MAIVMLGMDLAKNVFALHGVGNKTGREEMNRPNAVRVLNCSQLRAET